MSPSSSKGAMTQRPYRSGLFRNLKHACENLSVSFCLSPVFLSVLSAPKRSPFMVSQLHLLSPCCLAAVHRSSSSGLISSHGCACAARMVGVANLGCRRKSGASPKTRLESQASSVDCRHTQSPHQSTQPIPHMDQQGLFNPEDTSRLTKQLSPRK